MTLHFRHQIAVGLHQGHVIRRRDFLRGIATSGAAVGALSWTDWMSLNARELRRQGRACILLWMQGGPSQFETFSPKPGHASGGATKAIATSAPGIQVAENLPHIASVADELAIIRSMTSKEGAHPRATSLLHTGYLPTASVKYPAFGSVVAQQVDHAGLELPAFVRVGGRSRDMGGGGILGVEFDPFVMQSAEQRPTNSTPSTNIERYNRRLALLEQLEVPYAAAGGAQEVADHQKLYRKAAMMIQSPQMKAFDIEAEPAGVRQSYGDGEFASGCLLARRLVETGVPFVEVLHNGWDTHDDNFARTKKLCGQIDQPVAALIRDLKQRGLLESTLVVWMGEFGRTPKINARGGRDHFPRSFNVALAGGGVRGGQVIGKTDASGASIEDRPITVPDLFQTFCKSLSINPSIENFGPNGRPIKVVDSGSPISELFS